MKIILILAASFFISGCAVTPFPQFPDLKKHYLMQIKGEATPTVIYNATENKQEIPKFKSDETVRCMEFDVVSARPYKIKFVAIVELRTCHLVGGYKPEDLQQVLNWADDVYSWADERKRCFKN